MNTCIETLLDDIVRIDFYDASSTTAVISRSVPFAVAGVTEMMVTQGAVNLATAVGTPTLSLAYDGEDVGALMDTPKMQTTEKRDVAGLIRSHTLTIPVVLGFDAAQQADDALNGVDILAVLTDYEGNRLCIHYLPESTQFNYEDARGGDHTAQIKFTAQSLSALVKLTAGTTN